MPLAMRLFQSSTAVDAGAANDKSKGKKSGMTVAAEQLNAQLTKIVGSVTSSAEAAGGCGAGGVEEEEKRAPEN